MSDREQQRLDFLKTAGLADAVREALPGDASTRRYERLTTPSGSTLMLMDQPPASESQPCDPAWTAAQRHAAGWNAVARLSAGRIEAFVAVADHFRDAGVSTPEIVAVEAASGLAVIEDFGDDLFARVIEEGEPQAPLYLAAVDAVARLHLVATQPPVLVGPGEGWPLLTYDAVALQGGADLFVEWMPELHPDLDFGEAVVSRWRAAWAPVAAMGEARAWCVAHRDYHAENLIWLPDRTFHRRVGMIDFQDAVLAHPVWDLHSLLQDARRDVPPELETVALDYYLDIMMVDREQYRRDYAALAALNQARILGVFARLIARDGKPRYRDFMPRVWVHLNANLKKPGLETVSAWFDRHVPGGAARMTAAPGTAMVLAAGLGTRMRPLTDDRPKALVEVGGRPLIDHVLDRLGESGVERAVVNVHWFADRLESHLAARDGGPDIVISDERAELLETGGGLKKAVPLLGADPVFVANIDSVWTDNGAPGDRALNQLARLWNPSIMDAALLLARREGSIGFEGDGDVFLADDGRLTFRGDAPSAPFAYMGVHICRPGYVADGPDGPFSLSGYWRRSAATGRLFGCVLDGDWMHVGDPQARAEAEARLAGGG